MPRVWLAISLLLATSLCGADLNTVRTDLQNLSIDKTATWRVRELEISKGDTKIYLSEGVLAFATPVDGHRIAALFTTAPVEAGDAEIIALPPVAAERASLARFTQSPNLDEHFTSALLFFADNTAQDLLNQIHQHPLHPAPDLGTSLAAKFDDLLRRSAHEIDIRISQSILDHHSPANSFFYGMMAGRTLGFFDFIYQPDQMDSVVFGRVASRPNDADYFQIWSSYHPKDAPLPPLVSHISDYRIDAAIQADLSMKCKADFEYQADTDDGAVISLLLTPRLRVTGATIDGKPAEVLMHDTARTADVHGATTFLLVNGSELAPGSHHQVTVQYEGSVMRRTKDGNIFVDDRNVWYPFMSPLLTNFDLTFHTPENLRLVSTGEPLSEQVANGIRTVHRRTASPHALAGFNLGEYNISESSHPPYEIEICSNPQAATAPDLADQTARILQYYTARWIPLPLHSLAITPIEGYFGQGFPGLIYLSTLSYLREADRPRTLRNATLDSFFSQLLLPHELAHQWWGNIVTPLDYRSNWIVEAMANYVALRYLEETQGKAIFDTILAGYRTDLTTPRADGTLIDSDGPVTFDERLLNNFGLGPWHDILYEKGTWIVYMLAERMGAAAFHEFQLRVLKDFASRPISNEDLRAEAARFIPANQPDRQLTGFFDTWVYGTGIPTLTIKNGELQVTGVPESFTVDVPLTCGAKQLPAWQRASEGESAVPKNCSLPSPKHFLYRF